MNNIIQNSMLYGTGANPCYLNLNNTAKEYSLAQDATSPQNGHLDKLSRYILICNEIILSAPKQIVNNDFVPSL
jgi:hypothetical protein